MTWWKKKARYRRALWRHAIFWSVVFYSAFLAVFKWWAVLATIAVMPWILWRGFFALRLALFIPFRVDGRQQWLINPKISRKFRRKYRPGMDSNEAPNYDEPPPEVQNAIRAQVEMEDQDKGRPFSMPILRMRRLEK